LAWRSCTSLPQAASVHAQVSSAQRAITGAASAASPEKRARQASMRAACVSKVSRSPVVNTASSIGCRRVRSWRCAPSTHSVVLHAQISRSASAATATACAPDEAPTFSR
jgi:hypothetical protein